jgi:hypothetical protein
MQRVGRDSVQTEGPRRIVESAREMPEWQASQFRKTEVLFEDERFFVAEASRSPGRRYRYVLEPWPDDLADRPSRTILYDGEYIALRDAGRIRAWLGLLLWPAQALAMPVLGCLWNGTKRRLQGHLALNASRATNQSLLAEYVAVLLLGIYTWVLLLAPWAGSELSPLATASAAAALLLDAVLRYDHLQDHPEDLLGVGEWLVRLAR